MLNAVARWLVPYELWTRLRGAKLRTQRDTWLRAARQRSSSPAVAFDSDAALRFLASAGCDPAQVREGSMPRGSLDYCAALVREAFAGRAIRGLHIGNFVGMSLASFVHLARDINPESVIVSIDPNIPHRGIRAPMEKVIALLSHFGLEGNCMILTGYSLEKSLSNDGRDYTGGYVPAAHFAEEQSCAHQLDHLARLAPGRFDFAVVDGNHEGGYLGREVARVHTLLAEGGLLFINDASPAWFEILDVFNASAHGGKFTPLGNDGRVGALRKTAGP